MAKKKRKRSSAQLLADKNRTGRPPKAVADKQSEKVMVYMTKEERRHFGMMADEEGASLSALIMRPWREKGSH